MGDRELESREQRVTFIIKDKQDACMGMSMISKG
jgi:hypothetical protein